MEARGQAIVLIGMMGAGKSSVGEILQRRSGRPCVDLDALIAGKAGLSIPEIFAQKGETGFRDLEADALQDLPASLCAIIVTGGGIVLRPQNRQRLKQLGTIIWLDGDAAILFERATHDRTRPLLAGGRDARAVFERLLNERRPIYQELADVRIDTRRIEADEVAERILREVIDLEV
jgi:shikimate kinase